MANSVLQQQQAQANPQVNTSIAANTLPTAASGLGTSAAATSAANTGTVGLGVQAGVPGITPMGEDPAEDCTY